jgi:hypothetical protein
LEMGFEDVKRFFVNIFLAEQLIGWIISVGFLKSG